MNWLKWPLYRQKAAASKEHDEETNKVKEFFWSTAPHGTEEPNVHNNENWHTVGWEVTVFRIDLCSKPWYHLIELTDDASQKKPKRGDRKHFISKHSSVENPVVNSCEGIFAPFAVSHRWMGCNVPLSQCAPMEQMSPTKTCLFYFSI